jgi:predicted nucleic acid-binding protein
MIETVMRGETSINENQVEAILSALAFYCIEVPIYYQLRPNLKDENDNMVFECAAHFGASEIITHNVRDFLSSELEGYGINIITPGQFIHNIRRGQE